MWKAAAQPRPSATQFVLVVILILIFMGIAARRIWELRVVAEETEVIRMIGGMQSALSLQVTERVLKKGLDAVATMNHSNPIDYLKEPPPNYDLLSTPLPPEQMLPMHWYFDEINGILIYRVGNGEYLDTPLAGPARIRLQVQLRYDDRNKNGRYDAGVDSVTGLNLVPLDAYHWRTP